MKQIWKYQLTDASTYSTQTIFMPEGAEILCLQVQQGTACIWALVDPEKAQVARNFNTYGTGHDIRMNARHEYVGTYQNQYQTLVWHVFEIK